MATMPNGMTTGSGEVQDHLDDDGFCDHEERDVDILTGRATCWLCGHRWSVTDDELRRMAEAQAAYDELNDAWARGEEVER